jgi:UDP-N-acetylmuramate dehydrogenase
MQYFKNYKLKNSFNLPCLVDEIWFPESIAELSYIYSTQKTASIVSDCTNVICRPNIKKVISLKKLPSKTYGVEDNESIYLRVDANVKTHTLVQHSLTTDFSGLEGLFGLPGRIGSAIYGNSGSGNYCISDFLEYIVTINQQGIANIYSKQDLNFDRRYCILQDKKEIIVEARFKFPNKPVDTKLLEIVKEHRMRIPLCSAGGVWRNWHELKP